MRIPIVVPELQIGTEPLRISGWLVDEGDHFVYGDLVAEVLISGVTFDILSESGGRLVQIAKPVDAAVLEREIIGWLDDDL